MLVTGATGFIGARLCQRLLALGADVHGTSRAPEEADDGVRWWHVDLSDRSSTREVVRAASPDAIVHLASHVSGAPDIDLVWPTLQNNLLTTVSLLEAAVGCGRPRVVTAGTMVEPDTEAAGGLAGSPYAMAKAASSGYARMFHALYELPVVILRIFMVYGPGQRDLRKLIPHVIERSLRNEVPTVSSGRWEIDWVYIDDVVEAIVAALVAPDVEGGTFDVGTGQLTPIRSVVERIVMLTGTSAVPSFGSRADRPHELPRAADVESSRSALGWRPQTSLDEGLRQTIDWYRNTLAGRLPL